MKKILSKIKVIIFIVVLVALFPTQVLAEKGNVNYAVEVTKALNDESVPLHVKEWLVFFNSLTPSEQLTINYRPSALEKYNYEKPQDLILKNILLNTPTNADSIIPFGPVTPDPPGPSTILPVSGYELPYNPTYWSVYTLRANCYYYSINSKTSFDIVTSSQKDTVQPGYAGGSKYTTLTKSNIINAVMRDVNKISGLKGFREASETQKPGYREYKVALVLANNDYHWYRQNNDGSWSHKRGLTKITNLDASGKSINNPRLANRNYGYINYSNFCGYYFVKY